MILPFMHARPCPKCGSVASAMRYTPSGAAWCACPAPKPNGEHLERTCARCGFRWAETTLDYHSDPTVRR